MSSLFLDTSNKITYGLLDDSLNWVRYESNEDAKASKVLHSLVYDLLSENNLDIKKLDEIFYLSGPGSYTGVRVAQGFSEIIDWQNVDVYSCRHFDLPRILGKSEFYFISKAFKQEYFLYHFKEGGEIEKLVKEDEGNLIIKEITEKSIPLYSSEESFYNIAQSTYDLIKENSNKIFETMKSQKMKSEVYYYRSLDQEFKRGN